MSTLHTRWCCRFSSAPSIHFIPRQAATRCSLPISTRIVAFSRSLSTDKLLYCSRAVPATTTNALIYSSFAASYINNPSLQSTTATDDGGDDRFSSWLPDLARLFYQPSWLPLPTISVTLCARASNRQPVAAAMDLRTHLSLLSSAPSQIDKVYALGDGTNDLNMRRDTSTSNGNAMMVDDRAVFSIPSIYVQQASAYCARDRERGKKIELDPATRYVIVNIFYVDMRVLSEWFSIGTSFSMAARDMFRGNLQVVQYSALLIHEEFFRNFRRNSCNNLEELAKIILEKFTYCKGNQII